MKGLVVKSTGSWYLIRNDKGEIIEAKLAGKIRLEGRKTTNPVVVGDYVNFEIGNDEATAVITNIENRKNYIIRKSLNLSKQSHILASNLDQAILIATLLFPRTSTGFIDRFLVTAEAYSIPATIIFNKKDLLKGELLEEQKKLMQLYQQIGYPVYLFSKNDEKDVIALKEILKDKTTLIAGHSGVGKSSLINACDPLINQKTGEISEAHFKGKHTTTFTELFELEFGGFVIDSPGIKELGLVEMKKEEIGCYFPEMRKKLGQCKFNNCIHVNEPKCAVLEAVRNGQINPERYYNYLSILNGEEMDWNEWEIA